MIDGLRIGTLAMFDSQPRTMSVADKMNLLDLGSLASELMRSTRDSFVRMNEERANLLLSMTGNLACPLFAISDTVGSLTAVVAEECSGELKESMRGTLSDFERSKAGLQTLIDTSMSFGKLLNDYRQRRELTPCDITSLARDMQKATASHDNVAWSIADESFLKLSHEPHSYPDAIVFTLLSALSELLSQWNKIEIKVGFVDSTQRKGRRVSYQVARNVGLREETVRGFATIEIHVTDSVSGRSDDAADFNSSNVKRDFSAIHQILSQIEGMASEEFSAHGRKFHYHFPCCLLAHQKGGALEKSEIEKVSVLIADDSYLLRSILPDTIARCELSKVSSGVECLMHLQSKEYDIVIFSFLLPVMNGIEMFSAYAGWLTSMERNNDRSLFIGVGTGSDEEQLACFESGMHFFIRSPLDQRVLQSIIDIRARSKSLRDCVAQLGAAGLPLISPTSKMRPQ